MTPRDLNAAIRKASTVFVWIQYAPDAGVYLAVPKSVAREISAEATENSEHEVYAFESEGDLHIGAEDMSDMDPGAEEEEEEEPGDEEPPEEASR